MSEKFFSWQRILCLCCRCGKHVGGKDFQPASFSVVRAVALCIPDYRKIKRSCDNFTGCCEAGVELWQPAVTGEQELFG